jgi:hypothetical protein
MPKKITITRIFICMIIIGLHCSCTPHPPHPGNANVSLPAVHHHVCGPCLPTATTLGPPRQRHRRQQPSSGVGVTWQRGTYYPPPLRGKFPSPPLPLGSCAVGSYGYGETSFSALRDSPGSHFGNFYCRESVDHVDRRTVPPCRAISRDTPRFHKGIAGKRVGTWEKKYYGQV